MEFLKRILRKYHRQPSELLTSLSAMTPGELVRGMVELLTVGELRLHGPRKHRNLCSLFYEYDVKNTWVADWFLSAAQAKRDEGRTHYSIGNLLEKLRHDVASGVVKVEGFRISNELQSAYVRVILMRDPSLCGFFTLTRTSKADALVVDGRTWVDFAKEHEPELWPKQPEKKTAANDGQSKLPLGETA